MSTQGLAREKEAMQKLLQAKNWFYSDFSYFKQKEKNARESVEYRNLGNALYAKKKHDFVIHEKILEFYTKSVAFAPNESEELALAFGNRSAFLYHIGYMEDCIIDIDRAIKITKSDELKAKLLCRKVECLSSLKKSNLEEISEIVKKVIKEVKLDENTRKKYSERLINAIAGSVKPVTVNSEKPIPEFLSKPEIPCASIALDLKIDKKGEHIMAVRDIKVGEILSIEEAYSGMVTSQVMFLYCTHCLKFARSAIPCEGCFFVVFCSDKCKEEAWQKYHDIECPLIRIIGGMDKDDENNSQMLCIRAFIQGLKEAGSIKTLKKHIEEIDKYHGAYAKDVLRITAYQSLYILMLKIDIDDFYLPSPSGVDFVEMLGTLLATRLGLLNAITPLFGEEFKSPLPITEDSDLVFICALLLRHSVTSNRLISDVGRISTECGKKPEEKFISKCIFTFGKLLRHSCDPNAMSITNGRKNIIFACYPIKKGQEVTLAIFNLVYGINEKSERQRILKSRLKKTCNCTACRENWPLGKDIAPVEVLLSKFPKRADKCLDEFVKARYRGRKYDPNNPHNVRFSSLCNYIEILHKYVGSPCSELSKCTLQLQRYFGEVYSDSLPLPHNCN